MSRNPQRAELPDGKYNLVVQIPGWLKNEILEACAGARINQWVSAVLLAAVREARGLPPAPEPSAPKPTTADELRAYLTGEKLLQPCGKTDCVPEWQQVQNMEFCKNCGVRGI
jgi:hypothetical protein